MRKPLIFVHGSFHGGWCWAENWMEWFAERGHPSYAISLRGTRGSAVTTPTVTVDEHVADLAAFVDAIMPTSVNNAIFVGHSFGCITLLNYLSAFDYAGAAFLCPVPPSGNGPMTSRFLRSRPLASIKIVLGFVAKLACFVPSLSRDLFFGDTLDYEAAPGQKEGGEAALQRYMENFKADSAVGLNLAAIKESLPCLCTQDNGAANWLMVDSEKEEDSESHMVARQRRFFVLGAANDYLVDEEGVAETARFLGLCTGGCRGDSGPLKGYTLLPETPHDVMLGDRWQLAAEALAEWIKSSEASSEIGSAVQ